MLVRFRRLVVPVAVVVVAGGCWGQYRGDASHSGNQPTEFGIGTGNVSTLAESWVGTTGGVVDTAPTVINNVAYVGAGDGKLYAFDATGAGCSGSPKTCEPLWTATVQASGSIRTSPAVTGGVVLVQGRNSMEAFDANGVTNCSGSPKTCTPLWSTVALGDVRSSPAVAGATVFTTGTDGLKAFDAAAGSGTCGGTPKVCSPLWASSETFAPGWDASPAVAGSSVYVSGATAMYVYDAAGIIGCSGTPKKCTSSWKASGASAAPAVVNGTVYLAGGDHGLSAYDANGVKRCAGSPKICAPLWSATLSAAAGERVDPPAVANDVVYLPFRGSIYAFDTTGYVPGDALVTGTGTDRCLARTVNLCTPRWQTAPRSPASDLVTGAPLNAGGVLYAGGHDRLTAYDDSGNANCAAFPKVCDPLWSTPTAAAGYAPPVVVGGVVYSGSGNGLHAFQPSAVAPAPTIAAIAPNPGVGQTAVPVTVTGTGFTAGLTVSTTIPGASLGSPASVTPTSFTVSVTVPATTAPGSYKLAVKNPDQGLATTTIIASGGATGPDVAGRAGIAAYPGIVGGPAADRDHDLANVRDAGATWTAIDFDWKATQPTNSTTAPNWSALDPVVKSAHQRGLHVLGIITYSRKWASPN